MSGNALETRVKYLEKILEDKVLNKKNVMSDESKEKKDPIGGDQNPPVDPNVNAGSTPGEKIPPDGDDASFELVYPKFDVKSPTSGKMITVDRTALLADPDLLAWMRDKHADCFK